MDISIQGIAVHKQSILRESAKRSFIKVVKKLIIKRKTVLFPAGSRNPPLKIS